MTLNPDNLEVLFNGGNFALLMGIFYRMGTFTSALKNIHTRLNKLENMEIGNV
jgi:hypothetical protein